MPWVLVAVIGWALWGGATSSERVVRIAPNLTQCLGKPLDKLQPCLNVQNENEIRWYSVPKINGFSFEADYSYKLRVRTTVLPVLESTPVWCLVETLEKTPVSR